MTFVTERHIVCALLGYPFKAGHSAASTTYRDGLTTLPGHRQLVNLR